MESSSCSRRSAAPTPLRVPEGGFMTSVAIHPEKLKDTIAQVLGDKAREVRVALGEVTVVVPSARYLEAMQALRDAPGCRFEQLMDLCGMDYSTYGDREPEGARYGVVSHLLSVSLNQRVRGEAFDLFGIVFDGHNDLRRILTDYGFIGHPFRKDFPLSGHVEMRYDAEQRRVVYEPVSIEPRENTPRIIREDKYGGLH